MSLSFLLQPFALLFNLTTTIRNFLYDKKVLSSVTFDRPVICVGNLTVGGTGKTPHVEFIVRLLNSEYRCGIISRGYGRCTRGYVLANPASTPQSIGDEPSMYIRKLGVPVAVCESRSEGIVELLSEYPNLEVIVMDDGFQHRSVSPSFSVLLCDFGRPFFNDWLLPAGRLRESRRGAARAQAVVVSKCPENLSDTTRKAYLNQIRRYTEAPVFFSRFRYAQPKNYLGQTLSYGQKVLLVSGIANHLPLSAYVRKHYQVVKEIAFGDHHRYTPAEVESITNSAWAVLTTEKDAVKLPSSANIFVLRVNVEFEDEGFERLLRHHVQTFVKG